MSTATHRAPKAVTPRKATAAAVVGLTAGTVAMIPGTSQAITLQQAKTQYTADENAAENAGQIYDQQEEAYATLQQKIASLQDEISMQDAQLVQLDQAIGAQAAAQYRNSGISAMLQLSLSASPETYLDKVSSQSELANQEAQQVKTVAVDQADLRQEQALASSLIKQQAATLAKAKAAKAQADSEAQAAQELVQELTPAQQEQMNVGNDVGGAWTHYSGKLPVPSGRAAIAVQWALNHVGIPYETGGKGPRFDCSGFTQAAWAAAGVSIGGNSYEQWDELPHISEAQLQPGDLVFFDPTSIGPGHVTIYLGNGMLMQETHPGSYSQFASLDPNSFYYINMTVAGYARVQ